MLRTDLKSGAGVLNGDCDVVGLKLKIKRIKYKSIMVTI